MEKFKCPSCESNMHKRKGTKNSFRCNNGKCKKTYKESELMIASGAEMLTEEERNIINQYRGIKKSCDNHDLNSEDVKHGWLKNKESSLFFTNPNYSVPDLKPEEIDWKKFFEPIIKKQSIIGENPKCEGIFDRLVYTDTHIGMEPNPHGYSQYGGKWDAEELDLRMNRICNFVAENRKSPILIIDDLGDFADGWDGKTARKQHDLPQNMRNPEIFSAAMKFKMGIVKYLKPLYSKILINNVTNSNHGGDFDRIINDASKVAIDLMFPDDSVVVVNHEKFMSHYRIFNNVFILSHGKDDENLKVGLRAHITKDNIETISNYIDEHYLMERDCRIELSKGDSHQFLFDWASSEKFDYHNYPALSPSSNWVQTNFKKGRSGVVFFNYQDTERYDVKPLFFEWKK